MSTISRQFEINGEKIAYWTLGHEAADLQIIWAHGWGQDHRVFEQLAGSWAANAYNILIDFPGFGESPRPVAEWGTADYADASAGLLEGLPNGHRIWVGHSFGCRVGIQLAARHSEIIDALFLVAAAGLPRQRSRLSQFRIKSKIALYKGLRALPFGDKDQLLERFGSADYKAAGDMRAILTKVVNEDLSSQAQTISLPTKLVYGSQDDETPPEIGKRLAQLIPNGLFVQLDDLDHYSVLNEGRHQTAFQLKKFVDELEDNA